ncbi:MAG: prepilin-type N-terminal cleavage/methylation domain-containing protein [Candidatus Acidiferrales bacterium]
MNKRQKGFSLIELLIVVAIILIIAAIAIPNLLRSKMAANEAGAVGSLRTLVTADVTYSSSYSNGFAPTMAALGGAAPATCNNANLIDPSLAGATAAGTAKSGYFYTYNVQQALTNPGPGCGAAGDQTFYIDASPGIIGTTGQRSFCADQTGVIRFNPTGALIGLDASGSGCDTTKTAIGN